MALHHRQLEAFRRVMETGSVTLAAERVHLSQPAVSKLLAALERELNLALFIRIRKRLVPTDDAHLLYDEVMRQLASMSDIQTFARDLAQGNAGELNLVSAASIGLTLVADAVADVSRQRPGVRISHQVTTQIGQALRSRVIDFGFSVLWLQQADLKSVPLLHARAVLALPADHPLADRERIVPEDLQDVRFLSFTRDSRIRHLIDALFEQRQIDRQLSLEVYSSLEALPLVARGVGVCLVEPLASWYRPTPGVAYRPFDPAVEFTFNLLRPAQRPPTRIAGEFLAVLAQVLGDCVARSRTADFPIELRLADGALQDLAPGGAVWARQQGGAH